ncbi:MAG: serine/threonine protein kinase [Kofleriaceae bacterium]|nr:serine/threonine protein kinase [Kofleriaceae bacterium]MCL4224989.1 serine/threonine protein kinase [Myxococcales bacterium]
MQARTETATWNGVSDGTCRHVTRERSRVLTRGCAETRSSQLGERLGAYELLALLGEGGMAQVFLGEHAIMGRRVAIKQLAPALAPFPEAHRLFLREARVTASIRHSSIIDVYDFGQGGDGRPYYVMELAAGESLARRLVRGPLLTAQCFDTAIVLADAVATIHDAGYVHRDIKSDNVMLVRDGRRLVPKLIDFGIARRLAPDPDDPDPSEGVVGTLRTMAPEQITLDTIDQRTDVWALGVLAYEMITAHLPFGDRGSSRDEMLAIVTEPPRPLPDHVDGGLREIILACLAKDPAERPASADDLAERLREAQAAYVARRGFAPRAA